MVVRKVLSFWETPHFQVLLLMDTFLTSWYGKYTIIYKVFLHPWWCKISSINKLLASGRVCPLIFQRPRYNLLALYSRPVSGHHPVCQPQGHDWRNIVVFQNILKTIQRKWMNKYKTIDTVCIEIHFLFRINEQLIHNIEPQWPLFLKVNPSKQALLQSKTRVIGVLGICVYK